jgi:hypothetical protein
MTMSEPWKEYSGKSISPDPQQPPDPAKPFSRGARVALFLMLALLGALAWALFGPGLPGNAMVCNMLGGDALSDNALSDSVLSRLADLACPDDADSDVDQPALEPLCGNGERDLPQEMCDGSDLTGCISGQTCTDTCTCVWIVTPLPYCGDGHRDIALGEQCDGNDLTGCVSGSTCSNACTCILHWSVPTDTPSPPQPQPQPQPPPPACGDDRCDPRTENSDLCPQDCQCVDDGVCNPGEGATCLDCGENAGACGAPCSDSGQCQADLACAGGVCWSDSLCGPGGGTGGECPCSCRTVCPIGAACYQVCTDCNGDTCTP